MRPNERTLRARRLATVLDLPRHGAWLAAALPLALALASLSAHVYWLDSGELTAAAIWLDIAHPPGHPLAQLWGKLFSLLPCGPLPARVALGQAVACALAARCLYRALAESLAFHAGCTPQTSALVALGSTWVVAGSEAYLFQAIRAEVYALEAWLVCAALAELVTLACRPPGEPDVRPLYRALLWLALGLTNHHLVAFLALPAVLYELVRATLRHGARPWLTGTAIGASGLFVYAYLPARALTSPPLDLGHPATLGQLAWVVSARVFAHHYGQDAVQPLGERAADLAVLLVEQLGGVCLLLSLLGLYALGRARRTWPLAYVWGVAALCSLAGRAWLGPVRTNPDILGYLMPGLAAVAALAALGLATLLRALSLGARRPGAAGGALAVAMHALALAPLGAGLLQLVETGARCSLRGFDATFAFDLARERSLPARALLVTTSPTASFLHWSAQAVEHGRADVVLLPMPFLDYPGKAEALAAAHPSLGPLLAARTPEAPLPYPALRALAAERPVRLELDARVTFALTERLLPDGLLYRVVDARPDRREVAAAMGAREARLAALEARLGVATLTSSASPIARESARQLLWLHYLDALYLGRHGLRAAALRAAARGLRLVPTAPELLALRRALEAGREGEPLAPGPFLVGAPPARP